MMDMDMALHLFISFVRFFFYAIIVYYFMSRLLPHRLNIYGLITISLVYSLWAVLRRSTAFYGTAYHFWMNVFINVWTIFILLFFYQGKFWKRAIVYWYFDILRTLCEAMAVVAVLLYNAHLGSYREWAGIISSLDSSITVTLLYMLVFFPLFLLLGTLSLRIWRKALLQKFQPFYLLFIALPMGQRYSLALVIYPNMGDIIFGVMINFVKDLTAVYYILALFGISISLVATVAILHYVLSYNKREAVEAELRETKRTMEREQAHYRELEQRSEELVKIRHDFNNQLASIIQLTRLGENGSAQEIIDSLAREIGNTENP